MELDKPADRRRSISEIVADLARTEIETPTDPALRAFPLATGLAPMTPPSTPPSPLTPSAVTPLPVTPLKPRVETGDIGAPAVDPLPTDGPHAELAQMLTDAQARAASQRLAAERLLQETQQLEARLADEAARAKAANEQAMARELVATLERARADERAAAEENVARNRDVETFVARRMQTQKRQAELLTAHRVASDEFAEAKRRLESADAACRESDRLSSEAAAAEESARAEAATASQALAARRRDREELEQRLKEIEQRATATPISLPSLEAVEQLRALEARSALPLDHTPTIEQRRLDERALRVVQRRAADAQRNAIG